MPTLQRIQLLLRIVAVLGGSLILSRPASAQSIDYGALEQLFQEPVTTSATGSPQRETEVPANMEIITAEDIRRSGAYDLPGVLRHVVGVDFQQWTDDQAEISVRGYDQPFSQRLLVLINGRQVYADHFSFTPWSALPVELSAIRQIEIVKGPGSALFGFNAVGGVINIITYDPLYDEVDAASVRAGSQQLAQGSADVTFKLGQVGAIRLDGGARSNEDFSSVQSTQPANVRRGDNDRRNIDLDGAIHLGSNTSLRVEASETNASEYDVNPAYQADFGGFYTSSVKGQLNSDTPYGLVQATVYNNRIAESSVIGVLGEPMRFVDRVTVGQLQDIFKIGSSNTFRAAVEYRHESTNTSPFTGGQVFYNVASASGMWSWQLSPTLALTNALRYDLLALGRDGAAPLGYPLPNSEWSRDVAQVSFNSGLVWRVRDSDTLRLMIAQGTQLPNLVELGSLLYVNPYYGIGITGTPNLSPTLVRNYELDWDHDFSTWHARARAAIFYQITHDLTAVNGGILIGQYAYYATPINVGDSNAHGAELSFTQSLGTHWRWGANLRLELVTEDFINDANGANLQDPDDVTPRALANLSFGWSGSGWESDLYAQYQSATEGLLPEGSIPTTTDVNAYVSLDARVARRLGKHMAFSLSGQNLLHGSQQQTSGAMVDRRYFAELNATF